MSACVDHELDHIARRPNGNTSRVHLRSRLERNLPSDRLDVRGSFCEGDRVFHDTFSPCARQRLSIVDWSADWRKIARLKACASCANSVI
jgi:hypothetical protein